MKKILAICALAAAALPCAALDLTESAGTPDDIMLRRPRRDGARRSPRVVVVTNVVTRTDWVVKTNYVNAIRTGYVMQTNYVNKTRTDWVTRTNVVTETKTDWVTRTNVVKATRTDWVTKTNVVTKTKTDWVTKTNVVTQTDWVTKTNVVTETKTDWVTNVVTRTDYVVKTNVVTSVDDTAKREYEARLAASGAARTEAERKMENERKARATMAVELEDARRKLEAAENARKQAEGKVAAAEKSAADAKKQAADEKIARESAEGQVGEIAKKVLDERHARERAESARRVAERRAETERAAALAAKAEAAEATAVATEEAAPKQVVKEKRDAAQKKKLSGRDAIITAERTDYDRKEGVILFDRNVYVDDEQYQMHADRVFVFLDGTNDLKRLVAIGHVAITNEEKTAYCARATYAKATGKVVMYSNDEIKAKLREDTKKGSTVVGERITFWVNSEQVEVENPVISMPGGALKGGDAKKMFGK